MTHPPKSLHAKDAPGADLSELAERYLDFWQKNLTDWSTDPDLFQKWSRQIMSEPGAGADDRT
ncbi:MAG: hypothetical protein WEB93_06060 [Sphingomonadales bacterium]